MYVFTNMIYILCITVDPKTPYGCDHLDCLDLWGMDDTKFAFSCYYAGLYEDPFFEVPETELEEFMNPFLQILQKHALSSLDFGYLALKWMEKPIIVEVRIGSSL